jgi:D-arabinan exo alpha-(1,3)/(1,5)-arabinofuranosidase (non-reducing end)
MQKSLLVLGCFVAFCPWLRADTGYEALSDWSSLPYFKTGVSAGLFSSYDRKQDTLGADGTWNTNNDYNNYAGTTPDGWYIIGSLSGQGEITRFWMPTYTATHDNANIRFIADGVLQGDGSVTGGTTVLATTTANLFSGAGGSSSTGNGSTDPALFQSPLVTTRIGGQVSYEPIPFHNSMVVEIQPSPISATFYQVGYHLFPNSANIATYNGQLSSAQQTQRARAAALIGMNTPDSSSVMPAGAGGTPWTGASLAQNTSGSLAPGATMSLAAVGSAGTIQTLRLNLNAALGSLSSAQQDTLLRGLRVRIRYDSSPGNAVDVPVSQFFGVGEGRHDYQSLPLGVDPNDHSYYSYWPMPFHQNATVELYNASGMAVSALSAAVQYVASDPGANAAYFHAVSNSAITTAGQTSYQLLHVSGSGHYVGNILSVTAPDRTILEGDDTITVNGTTKLPGTGFEDAYNGGYYFNHIAQTNVNGDPSNPTWGNEALYGLLQDTDGTATPFRADAYRWMIGDYVPFTTGLDVSQENFQAAAGVQFESTAFYYSDSTSVPEPSGLLVLAGAAGVLLSRARRKQG